MPAYTFFAPAGTAPADFPGRVVAAMMPSPAAGQPAAWNTYVSVTDIDATAAKVTNAGGQVIVPPLDVDGQGRMAMFADDQGALISAWQPGAFPGCGPGQRARLLLLERTGLPGHRGGRRGSTGACSAGRPRPARWAR